jgi:hypothetical protein
MMVYDITLVSKNMCFKTVIIIGTLLIEMQFILRNKGPRLRWVIIVAFNPRFCHGEYKEYF